ncbi:hypothetical protein [Microbispora sp. CA-102843]|uniref:hypothetical protein n=1 Tax=Microbispora sp. CA-102843 TaxID=3239952 RepID=UPI003D8AF90C
MAADWLTPTVIGLLAGSAGSALTTLVRAVLDWRRDRREEERAPIELEGLVLGGAERLVASLTTTLDQNDKRIKALERDLAERDARIEHLEQDLTRAHMRIGRLQAELDRRMPPTPEGTPS